MHKENKITNIVTNVKVGDSIYEELYKSLIRFDKINSFIVYGTYNDEELAGYEIHFNISQNDKYNTLDKKTSIDYICEKACEHGGKSKKYVICYKQCDLTMLIKLYKPLIIKLAKEQHDHWNWLEMEDLIQMCNLVICDLYYKGYYIHKRLLYKVYKNYVLQHIRKDRDKPVMTSLEQTFSKSEGDSELTIADMIPDRKLIEEQDDKDDYEVQCRIIKEMKDILIDYIGIRKYDQLLREYKNKQTTPWSRRLMVTIKAHLYDMGISKKSFDKYYN